GPAEGPTGDALEAGEIHALVGEQLDVRRGEVVADDRDELHRAGCEQRRRDREVRRRAAQHVRARTEWTVEIIERDRTDHQERRRLVRHGLPGFPSSKASRARAAGEMWAASVMTACASVPAQP